MHETSPPVEGSTNPSIPARIKARVTKLVHDLTSMPWDDVEFRRRYEEVASLHPNVIHHIPDHLNEKYIFIVRDGGRSSSIWHHLAERNAERENLQKQQQSSIKEGQQKVSRSKSATVQPRFDPETTERELDAIQDRVAELAHVAHTIASLGVAGVDAAPVQVAGLHEVSTRTQNLARQIGLHAIAEGRMSQVQLGQLLGVHQATISRWVSEAAQEKQEPKDQ